MPRNHRRRPIDVAVDVVVLTLLRDRLSAVVVTRGKEPFKGRLALPGGFVHDDEDLVDAAVRELQEETSLAVAGGDLLQIGAYGEPDRDPRPDKRVVSVCYVALVPDLPTPAGGTDASDASVIDVAHVLEAGDIALAYDHAVMLRDAVERVRTIAEEQPIATRFLGEDFTMAELRSVYEALWGEELHPANFRHRVLHTPGFVEPTGDKRRPAGGLGRTAEVYRRGSATVLHPPLRRPGTYFRTEAVARRGRPD